MYMNNTAENYDYLLMIKAHALEKGMAMKKLRPFGQAKVIKIINVMKEAKKAGKKSTGYEVADSVVKEWFKIFEENNWQDELYERAKIEFDEVKLTENQYLCGKSTYSKSDIESMIKGNFEQFSKSRHSVRNYSTEKLDVEDVRKAMEFANRAPSACNRQMCKVYYVQNPKNREVLLDLNLGLSGFDKDNTNLFIVTYDIGAFNYYGERSQGFFNAGLFSMNFIYGLHYNGIGSCCLQWNVTNKMESKVKKILNIPKNEKIVVVIGAGYYENEISAPVSSRRKKEEIFHII